MTTTAEFSGERAIGARLEFEEFGMDVVPV